MEKEGFNKRGFGVHECTKYRTLIFRYNNFAIYVDIPVRHFFFLQILRNYKGRINEIHILCVQQYIFSYMFV